MFPSWFVISLETEKKKKAFHRYCVFDIFENVGKIYIAGLFRQSLKNKTDFCLAVRVRAQNINKVSMEKNIKPIHCL